MAKATKTGKERVKTILIKGRGDGKGTGAPKTDKVGPGNPPKEHQFTADKQPPPDAKRAGWDKKKKGKEMLQALMEVAFKGSATSTMKRDVADYFGIPVEDINVEIMMAMRQCEKAIKNSDTAAFNTIWDRVHGKPTMGDGDEDGTFTITVSAKKH